jgi:hypothetical protein
MARRVFPHGSAHCEAASLKPLVTVDVSFFTDCVSAYQTFNREIGIEYLAVSAHDPEPAVLFISRVFMRTIIY